MRGVFSCQGRVVSPARLRWLKRWIAQHPEWTRTRLAKDLCRIWKWRTPAGQEKTYASAAFLQKLEQRGLIELPSARPRIIQGQSWTRPIPPDFQPPTPLAISAGLSELAPLNWTIPVSGSAEEQRFDFYLKTHHYLGFNRTVGENLKYLISDRQGRDLACLLFGSSAWKGLDRDKFIGWDDETRRRNLHLTTNNTRFLILPWVTVPQLASHVLAGALRRLNADWQKKYRHPLHLVETFVDQERFNGTCYRAANWVRVGQTRGRGRQDRDQTASVPIKAVYVYPLARRFRQALQALHPSPVPKRRSPRRPPRTAIPTPVKSTQGAHSKHESN